MRDSLNISKIAFRLSAAISLTVFSLSAQAADIALELTQIRTYSQAIRFQDKLLEILPESSEVFEKSVMKRKLILTVRTSAPVSEWASKINGWDLDPGITTVVDSDASEVEVKIE